MDNITEKLFLYVVITLSAVVHEYSHAFIGNELGDDTAKRIGRLSLNPLRHIDPIGTVLVPLLLLFTSGTFIGWAKPVPYNPMNLKGRKDELKIALAGPASNLAISVLVSGLFYLATLFLGGSANFITIGPFVALIIYVNISLALFNLLPVPPLDGSKILSFILPHNLARRVEGMGFLGLIIALWVGMMVVPPIASVLFYIITGFGHLPLAG
ncbi:MAG: site-2 protease family protein [Candidatus Colwellbacteria bacterium]|nr:site-2 protease family protein [Candidatus Colwellbacteria bacterium]